MKTKLGRTHFLDYLWDFWCIISIAGIWPRFIEPNLLRITPLHLKIKDLPNELRGVRILQFSDLHLHPRIPPSYLNRIVQKVKQTQPDMILFTGDFLCNTNLYSKDLLSGFLNRFQAPHGCYAILGNHDYSATVSLNQNGDYDVVHDSSSLIGKGVKRLFSKVKMTSKVTEEAQKVEPKQELVDLLKETPFELLDNRTKLIPIKNSALNLIGVGEKMMGKCLPKKAYRGHDPKYPGIVMAHNPDCIPELAAYPGDIILCGHTHGAQVNLPFIWKRFMLIENMKFKRGLFREGDKWAYVNRGVGSTMPFRWFSVPEITLLTLEKCDE